MHLGEQYCSAVAFFFLSFCLYLEDMGLSHEGPV